MTDFKELTNDELIDELAKDENATLICEVLRRLMVRNKYNDLGLTSPRVPENPIPTVESMYE